MFGLPFSVPHCLNYASGMEVITIQNEIGDLSSNPERGRLLTVRMLANSEKMNSCFLFILMDPLLFEAPKSFVFFMSASLLL